MTKYTCDIADPNDTRKLMHKLEDIFSLDKIAPSKFFHPFDVGHFIDEYNKDKKTGKEFGENFYNYALYHMINAGASEVVNYFYKYKKISLPAYLNDMEKDVSTNNKKYYGIHSPLFVAAAFGRNKIFQSILGYVENPKLNHKTWTVLLKLAISSQDIKMVKDIVEVPKINKHPHSFCCIDFYKLILQTAVLYPNVEVLTYVTTVIKNACCPEYLSDFEEVTDTYYIHGSKINGSALEGFLLAKGLTNAMSFDTAITCGFFEVIQSKLSREGALLTNAQLEKCITHPNLGDNLTRLKPLLKNQEIPQELWQKGLTLALQEKNEKQHVDTNKLETAWYFLFKMDKPLLNDLLSVYGMIQKYEVADFIKDVMLEKFARYLSVNALSRYSLDELMDNLKKAAIAQYSFIESHIEDYAKVAFAAQNIEPRVVVAAQSEDLISFDEVPQPSLVFRPQELRSHSSQNSLNTTSASGYVSPFKDDSGNSWTPFKDRP